MPWQNIISNLLYLLETLKVFNQANMDGVGDMRDKRRVSLPVVIERNCVACDNLDAFLCLHSHTLGTRAMAWGKDS